LSEFEVLLDNRGAAYLININFVGTNNGDDVVLLNYGAKVQRDYAEMIHAYKYEDVVNNVDQIGNFRALKA